MQGGELTEQSQIAGNGDSGEIWKEAREKENVGEIHSNTAYWVYWVRISTYEERYNKETLTQRQRQMSTESESSMPLFPVQHSGITANQPHRN